MGGLRKVVAKLSGQWKAAHDSLQLSSLPPARYHDNAMLNQSIRVQRQKRSKQSGNGSKTHHRMPQPSEFAQRGLRDGMLDWLFRPIVVSGVAISGRVYMQLARGLSLHNERSLHAAMQSRDYGRGLLTASNHSSALDDPLVLAASVPTGTLLRPSAQRWGTCASDRCFKDRLLAHTLRCGKVLPVDRGAGLEQEGMRRASDKLASGEWVHVFPEGTRRGETGVGQFKRGIGKLVLEGRSLQAENSNISQNRSCTPLVLPFAHTGMAQPGARVNVAFGEPVDVSDIAEMYDKGTLDERSATDAIAARVESHVRMLHHQLRSDDDVAGSRSHPAHDDHRCNIVSGTRTSGADTLRLHGAIAATSLPLWSREGDQSSKQQAKQRNWLWLTPAASQLLVLSVP